MNMNCFNPQCSDGMDFRRQDSRSDMSNWYADQGYPPCGMPPRMIQPPRESGSRPSGRAPWMPAEPGSMSSGTRNMSDRTGGVRAGMRSTPMPADMGTAPADMGTAPMQSNMGTAPTNMGTMPSNMGTMPTNMGTMPSNMGTMPSNMGTMPANMVTMPENMETMPANMETAPETTTTVPSTGNMPAGSEMIPETQQNTMFCEDLDRFPIGMGYVPMQRWSQPSPIDEGFSRGTIFAELDLPFVMGRCM